jgi:uncharacterized membrane protein YcaP (DUF421 family)
MYESMWQLSLPVVEKILRPIIVYLFLILLLRVFGKRELAQLNPFDLVVLLCLSNTVQNAIIGNDNSLTGGLVGALALVSVNYVVVRYLFRHRRLDEILAGKPAILIAGGKIHEKAMAKEMLTHSELLTAVHRQGFAHIRDVQRCVLEPGGAFFIEGKTPTPDEQRQAQVLASIESVEQQLRQLREQLQSRL